MDYPEARAVLLAGRRIRRKTWAGDSGDWAEMVKGPLADGRPFAWPVPMVWLAGRGFVPFSGLMNDEFKPAGDWEEVT